MSVNIVVPEVGESIVDARVARWLKKTGDVVAAGEALVELETDKVDVEVAAPQAGVIETIAHGDGADVKIGDVLGTIAQGAASASAPAPAPAPAPKADAAAAAPKAGAAKAAASAQTESAPAVAPTPSAEVAPKPTPSVASAPTAAAPSAATEIAATPSARRLAREQDVELRNVKPDGARVTIDDVAKTLTKPAKPVSEPPSPVTPPKPAPLPELGKADGSITRVRMSKRRATIARRLVEAQQTAAMLTTFNEVDMSGVMALRERHKEAFKAKFGVGLGIASFFVKAAVAALAEFPRLNAEIQGDEMLLKNFYDIGVAVGAAEGLVVPVLRGADRMSFAQIETAIRGFAKKAADNTLTLDDLRGGTFSITNGGVYGSLMSTPILNPPQVGILGLHAIKDRPIAVNGQVVLRPMMYTALTYDHRIVDGSEAVQFLVRIKTLVEDPASLVIY